MSRLARLRKLPGAVDELVTPASRSVLAAKLPSIFAVCAAVLVAGQLALLTRSIVVRPQALRAAATPASGAATDPRAIVAAALFGRAPVVSDAPASGASLRLFGTIAMSDPAHGYAIVGEKSASAHLAAAGAILADGVRLVEVFTDRIIIDRGGVREAVGLPHFTTGGTLVAPVLATDEPAVENSYDQLVAQQQAQATNEQQLREVARWNRQAASPEGLPAATPEDIASWNRN